MEKKEIKDQFVIAYFPNLKNTQAILDNAIAFAKMLDKGLILLHISDGKYNRISTEQAEEKLKEINNTITDIPFHSYCALKGKTKEVLFNIPKLLSGVLIVTSVNEENIKESNGPKELLKNLYNSRIAYFVTNEKQQRPLLPLNSIVLTLNHLRESKEKVLWASYFGRFAKSEIKIFHHNYKDEFYKRQLYFNLKFAKKMFDNFNLNYSIYTSDNSKTFVDYQSTEYAKQENSSLVICQTTKNKDWTNRLFGLKEEKTIINKEEIPVLFVNPREDLFVLCD